MSTRPITCLALTLFMSALIAGPAHAQVLGRASGAARGSSGQQGQRGSSGTRGSSGSRGSSDSRGSSRSGRRSEGGSSRGSDDVRPDRSRARTICHGSRWRCIRKTWRDAGLAEVGGLITPWATVLSPYPYADGHGGYARAALDEDYEDVDARTAFRLEVELGYVLEGAARVGAAARVQFQFFVDLATRYSLYLDPERDESLAIGRTWLDLRLVDSIGIQLRVGLGLLHFQDELGGLFGPLGRASIDLFFVSPLVISASASVGIAEQAMFVRAVVRAGLLVDGTEIYVGYHHESVAGPLDYVELRSPMLGVRQWW